MHGNVIVSVWPGFTEWRPLDWMMVRPSGRFALIHCHSVGCRNVSVILFGALRLWCQVVVKVDEVNHVLNSLLVIGTDIIRMAFV
jgi:hypothetical protein